MKNLKLWQKAGLVATIVSGLTLGGLTSKYDSKGLENKIPTISMSTADGQEVEKNVYDGNIAMQIRLWDGLEDEDVGVGIKVKYTNSDRDCYRVKYVVTEPNGQKFTKEKYWEPGAMNNNEWWGILTHKFPVKSRPGKGMLKIYLCEKEVAYFFFTIDRNGFVEWKR